MPYRSLFHRSLDVLTCIYNNETEMDAICEHLDIGTNHVEELVDKLTEWELIEEYSPVLTVSDRGRNVLSFYHNYSKALDVGPTVYASVPDY